MHMRCTCGAHAAHMRRTCSARAVHVQCTCNVHARCASGRGVVVAGVWGGRERGLARGCGAVALPPELRPCATWRARDVADDRRRTGDGDGANRRVHLHSGRSRRARAPGLLLRGGNQDTRVRRARELVVKIHEIRDQINEERG
eukprot:scaffold29335_cov66-Phaeocystis_antarctica.AAC.1